ncbi:MAG TPA: AAA family ATPase [Longimicrobium sp.]|nr:AAA family ATPase [Longimicrobium sp.]
MEGKRLIQRLSMRNFLSYGSEGASIDLLPLNVLIGPNASGKSNLIAALAVLRATAGDLASWIRQGGGIEEYLRKSPDAFGTEATLEAWVAEEPDPIIAGRQLHYEIVLSRAGHRLQITRELIEYEAQEHNSGISLDPFLVYELNESGAVILQFNIDEETGTDESVERVINRRDLAADQSILTQRRDPDVYPTLTYLADQFGSIATYTDWTFGRLTRVRTPQPTDLPTNLLLPDGSNMALVLHEMLQRSKMRERFVEYLRRFYDSAQHISTTIQGGTVQLLIEESGGELIPATRLSDGTLRYLALLTILLHPSPPPLVCIEEPELGLHPDILPIIAELLLDASKRTQLVVTTHSDALVSALSEVPESIVVCESSIRGTELRRLDRDALAEWLNQYSLGELWRIGGIGGTRW